MSQNHYPQRKSPRLRNYDYSQSGAYFITICTHRMTRLFGCVEAGVMLLNHSEQIATNCWAAIPEHFAGVELDVSVVMPNHVHCIILLPGDGASLSVVIGAYKAAVTRVIRREVNTKPPIIWHRSYHDRIIQNERALAHIRTYILNNPLRWQMQ